MWQITTTTNELLAHYGKPNFNTAVVTGVSAGLGFETARALLSAGVTVIGLARAGDKLEAARLRLLDLVPDASLHVLAVDLAESASVRTVAEQITALFPSLDLLVNNAGVMAQPLARNSDGIEMQFAGNYLGHFLLTNLLMPALLASQSPRVICLSSGGHKYAPAPVTDAQWQARDYDKWLAYGEAKSACSLLAVALQQRLGGKLDAFAVHPGAIGTDLGRHLTAEDIQALMSQSSLRQSDSENQGLQSRGKLQFKSVEAGAATTFWAALAPELKGLGGRYLEDCSMAQQVAYGESAHGYYDWAIDASRADALWQYSEQLLGQSFDWS